MIDAGISGSAPPVAWLKKMPSAVIRNQKMIEPTTGPRTRAAPPISSTV